MTIYENLVFEGGGILSFAYCGVISELNRQGVLHCFKRFAGTSTGAIFAALLAADFTAEEILKLHKTLTLDNLSIKYDLTSIFNISKKYGQNSSLSIRKQIEDVLNTKLNSDISLADLFEKTKKELVLVSCCINRKKPIYFHHATFGNVKLIDAIIASLSVPLFFQPLALSVFETEDFFVDGGLVDNYPIWIFNNIESLYQNDLSSFDREEINHLTLGLKLLGTVDNLDERKPIDGMFNFISQLVDTLISQIKISSKYQKQTILIPTGSIYFLDFNISKEKIEELFICGIVATKNHFDTNYID